MSQPARNMLTGDGSGADEATERLTTATVGVIGAGESGGLSTLRDPAQTANVLEPDVAGLDEVAAEAEALARP